MGAAMMSQTVTLSSDVYNRMLTNLLYRISTPSLNTRHRAEYSPLHNVCICLITELSCR